jgi:hypothetical protein
VAVEGRIGRAPPPAYVTGQEPASAAFSFDPFIPTAQLETDWVALSKGAPEYPQIRIPFRPAYHSPYKPRFRRTRRLRDNPFPFSPTDYFGDPVLYSGVDSPRL